MKVRCPKCKTRHNVASHQIHSAGSAGVTLKCQGCGASIRARASKTSSSRLKQSFANSSAAQRLMPALTDIHHFDHMSELPAFLSPSGTFKPRPEVEQRITGLHMHAADDSVGRVWFAAINGKTKGPYTEDEVLLLAEVGKLRGRSLLWKPGFKKWIRVRNPEGDSSELDWVRKAVLQRKQLEVQSFEEARKTLGVKAMILNREARMQPTNASAELLHNSDDIRHVAATLDSNQNDVSYTAIVLIAFVFVTAVPLGAGLFAAILALSR